MKDIYNDNSYLSKNPTWQAEDASFKADKIIELLKRNKVDFKTVCEVGCGSGEILVQLESRMPYATAFFGFDISKDAINIARKKETDKIKFEVKNISNNNNEEHYDLMLVIDVIEHVENYFEFLEGIVHKGSYTVFHIPLDMYIWSLFREQMLIESKNRVGHIHNFTENFIINILKDCGFEIIDKIYTEPILKNAGSKQKFIHLLRKSLFRINKRFCTKTIGGYSIMVLTKNNP